MYEHLFICRQLYVFIYIVRSLRATADDERQYPNTHTSLNIYDDDNEYCERCVLAYNLP